MIVVTEALMQRVGKLPTLLRCPPHYLSRIINGGPHHTTIPGPPNPCYPAPMRALALLALLASPAHAWQAGTEGRLCTLTQSDPAADIRLTYDPSGPLYTITVTTPAPWPEAPVFGIRFDGPQPNTITTNRHERDGTGHSLTVTDRGFGNVLDGLEFNTTATAFSGQTALPIDLTGAAPEVQAFRACTVAPAV